MLVTERLTVQVQLLDARFKHCLNILPVFDIFCTIFVIFYGRCCELTMTSPKIDNKQQFVNIYNLIPFLQLKWSLYTLVIFRYHFYIFFVSIWLLLFSFLYTYRQVKEIASFSIFSFYILSSRFSHNWVICCELNVHIKSVCIVLGSRF